MLYIIIFAKPNFTYIIVVRESLVIIHLINIQNRLTTMSNANEDIS